MNSFSTPKALLLSMLILLCITSCKKTTETISDGIVSSGINITLDVDGGSKVIVNPMGRMVSKQHINGVETWRAASVPTGVYIFRLNGKSQKIVIK